MTAHANLAPYLRSLWNIAPALIEIDEPAATRTFLSPLGMHLPRHAPAGTSESDWFQAAAAHASAHLTFPQQQRFDTAGLRPVTQVLLGALEDARVEWLACRELPGLRRLWRPFHQVAITDTPSFEDLLRRLALTLLDPQHHDPHPWVMKARALFFVDDAGDMLALRQPETLRHAASLLGNDIGQMRLQFNARLYTVSPSYRDDNSHLWATDPKRAETEHTVAASPPAGGGATAEAEPQPTTALRHTYPEWDRQVPVLRPAWCVVHDATETAPLPPAALSRPVRAATRQRVYAQPDGDEFDLDALVDACVAQRSAVPSDRSAPRIYQGTRTVPAVGPTLLLLDTSASTEALLPAARDAVLRCAATLARAGADVAIHSFCSEGRLAVHYTQLKTFGAPLDTACLARLNALRSRWSTRLGAALRHATALLGRQRGDGKRLLLFTDGKPHDVDVHDPRYLIADARHAVRDAARRGVQMHCVGLDAKALAPLRQVFGAPQVHSLKAVAAALGLAPQAT